ncbi:MAG: hypothetical protein ABIJ21_07535 [Nanoarchaeota archaeon]
MNPKSDLEYVLEIIEALRGKTVIDAVTIRDESGKEMTTYFDNTFLNYVLWNYHEQIDITQFPQVITIQAHHLFGNPNDQFSISAQPKKLTFLNKRRIEETLYLDLTRYCDHNNIVTEVIE